MQSKQVLPFFLYQLAIYSHFFGLNPGKDCALRCDILPQERPHILLGNGVKHLREAEGIVTVEIPFCQRHGNVFKGVESPQIAAEGCPAHLLVEVLIKALVCQTAGLLLNLLRD